MAEASVSTKRCPRCGETKPTTEFQKNKSTKDGLTCYCKPCWKIKCREYGRKPENKARLRGYCRKFRNSERGKTYFANWQKAYAGTDKQKARSAVYVAVFHSKTLPRARSLKCQQCGQQADSYHHHKGYAPEHHLDVIPLCRLCHTEAERTAA